MEKEFVLEKLFKLRNTLYLAHDLRPLSFCFVVRVPDYNRLKIVEPDVGTLRSFQLSILIFLSPQTVIN